MRGDLDSQDDQPEVNPERHNPAESARPSGRVFLIVALLMIGAGYFLTIKLRDAGRLQDCVMSGRTNCAPISGEKK
jgi:hypothetical protein